MTNEDYQEQALRAAGKMADISGAITGNRLTARGHPCNAMQLSQLLEDLYWAVDEYNNIIFEWSEWKNSQ